MNATHVISSPYLNLCRDLFWNITKDFDNKQLISIMLVCQAWKEKTEELWETRLISLKGSQFAKEVKESRCHPKSFLFVEDKLIRQFRRVIENDKKKIHKIHASSHPYQSLNQITKIAIKSLSRGIIGLYFTNGEFYFYSLESIHIKKLCQLRPTQSGNAIVKKIVNFLIFSSHCLFSQILFPKDAFLEQVDWQKEMGSNSKIIDWQQKALTLSVPFCIDDYFVINYRLKNEYVNPYFIVEVFVKNNEVFNMFLINRLVNSIQIWTSRTGQRVHWSDYSIRQVFTLRLENAHTQMEKSIAQWMMTAEQARVKNFKAICEYYNINLKR